MTSNEQIQIRTEIHSYCQSLDGRRLRSIAIASLLASTVCLAGCQQMGFRARDHELTRMIAEQDDWALPQSPSSRVPRPNVNDFKSPNRREKTISALGDLNPSSRDRNYVKKQSSVVDYGTANDSADTNDRNSPSVLSSPDQEIDFDGALALLPPAYRDLMKNQFAAVQRQGRLPVRETRTLSDDRSPGTSELSQHNVVGKADLQQTLAKDRGTSKVSIRRSDDGGTDPNSVTTANSIQPAADVATASTAIAMMQPANNNANYIVSASALLPMPTSPPATSSVSIPTANAVQATSPTSWRQSLNQAIEQLEKQVKDAPAGDDNLRISQEVTLRMLYVSQRRLDDALRPIDKLSNSEKDYFHHQMLALFEASNPDAMPVRSRHWSLVMNSQREATSHLAAVSNLEIKSVSFCTEVERYGVFTKFPKYQFQADQELLLYCEIENVAAIKVKEGYESQLQGSYEIIDSQGRKVADQLLPMEPEVCQNHRRDYFIVYKIYMPQQIVPGSYQLRLTVEDMKARKYGQNQLDFQVKK